MSVRLFTTVVISAVLLSTLVAMRTCAETPSPKETAAQARLVQRVYSVADLVIPVDGTPAAKVAQMQKGKESPCGEASLEHKATTPTLENQLMKLISRTIAPESWAEKGGPAKMEFYPVGMALIVNQTPEVQEQIDGMLSALRRLQDLEVCVEVRLLSVSPSLFFERIGIDFEAPAPVVSKSTPAVLSKLTELSKADGQKPVFLNDKEVFLLMEACQGDARTCVMQSPKLTLFNGQAANINCTEQQAFVTGVNVTQKDGQVVAIPQTEVLSTGLRVSAQPVVSADRRYVNLKLNINESSIDGPVPLFPVITPVIPHFEGGLTGPPQPVTQFIQQPKLNTHTLDKSLCIPDGGTALMTGWTRMREARNEFGPPVLSKIPYVNRLFKNVGYSQEAEQVMVMVTARVIVNEEEETRAGCPAACKTKDKTASAPTAVPGYTTPLDNLRKLEQATAAFRQAEIYRQAGKLKLAERAYETAEGFAPGSSIAGMASQCLAQLHGGQVAKATEADIEEQETPLTTPESVSNCKVPQLIDQYNRACRAGRFDEATKLAVQALAIDPACFSKNSGRK